jgi:hypothetical protein
MNVRVIPRTALNGYLKLVRMPVDTAIGLLPGNGASVKPAAQLAVDRADANLRSMAGAVLGDSVLREDAERRSRTVRERERGLRLRTQAEETADNADARLQAREEQAAKQRQRARETAANRRRQAEAQAREVKQRAGKNEARRREASGKIAAEQEEAIQDREPREELQALEAKTQALRAREDELAARDEARRLAGAARQVKAQRRSNG